MDKEEKFLPVGTVVILKNGKRELMITSYYVMPAGETYDKTGKIDARGKMYDYGACLYPEGLITSDQIFVFNHEQIEKVCYKGYVTDKQKQFSDLLLKEGERIQEEMKKALEQSNQENVKGTE